MEFNMHYVRTHLRLKMLWLALTLVGMSVSATALAEVSTASTDAATISSQKQNLGLVKAKISEFLQTHYI